jgi:hypothetical protein
VLQLTRREEALVAWEENAKISEKALVKVSVDLNSEQVKIEATQQEYLNMMRAHTDRAKHTLGLDKMLGEKKVQLDKKERDLALREAALIEAALIEAQTEASTPGSIGWS